MGTKCTNCGLVSFAENEACRRCGMPLAPPAPGEWMAEPRNPGSVVGTAPSYGMYSGGDSGSQGWAPPQGGYGPSGGGYGNAGHGGGYGSQAYGGTQGTYAPPYGQQGGYAPTFGMGGYASAQYVLAERGHRLLAAIVDSLCMLGPILLAVLVGSTLGKGGPLMGILVGFVGILAVLVAQLIMLVQRGQTIGKRMMGIRIVKADTGLNGGAVTNLLLRNFVPGLIGMVPYIGPLFSIVNVCFIFAEDRRCVHDHIAGTVVVQGDPP